MHTKLKFSSRLAAATGLIVLGAMMADVAGVDDSSTTVANKWKVRPSANRNYRRFYRNSPPMGPMMPYYGEGEVPQMQELQGDPQPAPTPPPEELPRRNG